tara:strand:+ start:1915 stop:3291 length:1377 start_codon:yes stop_codon:yes gene_type:complete
MIKKPYEIALVCNRSTGVAILGRMLNLFQYKQIKANYTVIISSTSSIKEVEDLMPRKIEYKIIRISSFSEKIYQINSLISRSDKKVNFKKYVDIKPRRIFSIKSILIIFLKISMRIIDIVYLRFKFKNRFFDYAIFQNDLSNNILMHLIGIFRRKKIVTILPELAYPSLTWKISSRKQQPSNYVEEKGLFSYLFSDQKLNADKNYMLTYFSPEETIALYCTGVLPRYPKKLLGSLSFDKILLSSNDLYESSILSPFTKSSKVYKCLSINEEIALISRKKRLSIRKKFSKKYNLINSLPINLFSVTNLGHTNFFSDEESEEIQIKLIKKIINITPQLLIMFHPSISTNQYKKTKGLFKNKIVDEPLPYLSSIIDIFISLTETSAEQYLLPLGAECIIFYHNKSWLYGIYDNYRNLNCFKINDPKGFKRISELNKLNFINTSKSKYPKGKFKTFTECFFD